MSFELKPTPPLSLFFLACEKMKVAGMVMLLGLQLNKGVVSLACGFCDDGGCMNCW